MTPREYNNILAIVASRANDVVVEDDGNRRSGKTFRSVIRLLLHSSAKSDSRSLYATMSRDTREHAFQMAVNILQSAGVDFRANRTNYTVSLPNQSVIEFRCSIDTGYAQGRKFDTVARDVDGR